MQRRLREGGRSLDNRPHRAADLAERGAAARLVEDDGEALVGEVVSPVVDDLHLDRGARHARREGEPPAAGDVVARGEGGAVGGAPADGDGALHAALALDLEHRHALRLAHPRLRDGEGDLARAVVVDDGHRHRAPPP